MKSHQLWKVKNWPKGVDAKLYSTKRFKRRSSGMWVSTQCGSLLFQGMQNRLADLVEFLKLKAGSFIGLREAVDANDLLMMWERTLDHYMTSRAEAAQKNVRWWCTGRWKYLWGVSGLIVYDFQWLSFDLKPQEFLVGLVFQDDGGLVEVLVQEGRKSGLILKVWFSHQQAVVYVPKSFVPDGRRW